MNIGSAIKKARQEAGMSQGKLVVAVGITQTAMSAIECGKTVPHPATLDKICKSIGIPEVLLRIMAIEESDIPEGKQDAFRHLMPAIETLCLQILK